MTIKLPENMSYEAGAMIEPVSVAVHALGRAREDLTGKHILVLGAGRLAILSDRWRKDWGQRLL